MKMELTITQNVFSRQRIAFYIALANFLWLIVEIVFDQYFAAIGDSYARRHFFYITLPQIPFWGLSWIIAFITISNSISESKQATWYGVATLAMLAVPAIPLAVMVFESYWNFVASS